VSPRIRVSASARTRPESRGIGALGFGELCGRKIKDESVTTLAFQTWVPITKQFMNHFLSNSVSRDSNLIGTGVEPLLASEDTALGTSIDRQQVGQ
jgi:hypothetical protein